MMSAPSTIADAEAALAAARLRLDRIRRALAEKGGATFEQVLAAKQELLAAERCLAAARGEPHAVPIEFPVLWDAGAPLPHLLRNDYRTFLLFLIGQQGNSRPQIRSDRIAIVEFKRCICAKMGTPNDEVLHGHPLHGKGLAAYQPQRVENSPWIKELEIINSVHRGYKPESWRALSHFIFGFHDSTFECVAHSFNVETRDETFVKVMADVCNNLVVE
jgi:hypothetical protein